MLFAAASAAVGIVASCSSPGDSGVAGSVDGGVESSAASDGSTADAGAPDSLPPQDAASFDGGPLPIVCGSSPCVLSLTTTTPSFVDGFDEGFCALMNDGTVACWGANGVGQLGRGGDAGTSSADPERVVGLTDVVRLEHTCALDQSGAFWCWGRGAFLQNDAGGITSERTPVRLPLSGATSMSVAGGVGCAAVDGGVLCWGSNDRGQIAPFDVAPRTATLGPHSLVLPPGGPVRNVVTGPATFAWREDGAVLSWGANRMLARASSLDPDPYPRPLDLPGVATVDFAPVEACAAYAGIGYCWSSERPGPPEPVVIPEPIVQIATAPKRWCAVTASGAVYCRGVNSSGQAGDGTKEHAYEAVEVKGLPAAAVEVRTTPTATCVLSTNGKVYCFGANQRGQLGNRAFKVPSLVPVEVVLP